MVRWHCPANTGFEVQALAVWGRACYLSVKEVRPQYWINTSERGRNILFLWNPRPEGGLKPRYPIFQAGSFNHCTRTPTLYKCESKHINTTVEQFTLLTRRVADDSTRLEWVWAAGKVVHHVGEGWRYSVIVLRRHNQISVGIQDLLAGHSQPFRSLWLIPIKMQRFWKQGEIHH